MSLKIHLKFSSESANNTPQIHKARRLFTNPTANENISNYLDQTTNTHIPRPVTSNELTPYQRTKGRFNNSKTRENIDNIEQQLPIQKFRNSSQTHEKSDINTAALRKEKYLPLASKNNQLEPITINIPMHPQMKVFHHQNSNDNTMISDISMHNNHILNMTLKGTSFTVTREKPPRIIKSATSNSIPDSPDQTVIKREPVLLSLVEEALEVDGCSPTAKLPKSKDENLSMSKYPFRHLIFNPNVDVDALKKHLRITYKGLKYSTTTLRGPSDQFLKGKYVDLPFNTKFNKTLVLDLDETLIHSTVPTESFDVAIKIRLPNRQGSQTVYVKKRPYVTEFLQAMSEIYEIIVFTASPACYAKEVVDMLDPTKKMISYLLTRQHCMETMNGNYIKDLRIMKNRSLKNMIIIDNLVHSFGLQLENGIPILEFKGNEDDRELKYIGKYLTHLARVPDVREYNRNHLRLRHLLNVQEGELY
jgi:CTD small phosphatase-like protein 2